MGDDDDFEDDEEFVGERLTQRHKFVKRDAFRLEIDVAPTEPKHFGYGEAPVCAAKRNIGYTNG